ncbi:hypothetical protein NDU88_008337 [Pleurodeles waltl]|uniref:Uncharacterized protein n=1 Tax=Pleurodeles waltl TaxID=8319 RepID=A0AAV7SV07_PLEWA|nr:hypothetical protein NDU88_008337 [Pleurodeles waltl]
MKTALSFLLVAVLCSLVSAAPEGLGLPAVDDPASAPTPESSSQAKERMINILEDIQSVILDTFLEMVQKSLARSRKSLVSAAPEGLGLREPDDLASALLPGINMPTSKFLQVFVKRVAVLQIWRKTYVVDYCFVYMEDIVLLYRSCSIEAMCLESDTHRQSLSSCADQFFCFVI